LLQLRQEAQQGLDRSPGGVKSATIDGALTPTPVAPDAAPPLVAATEPESGRRKIVLIGAGILVAAILVAYLLLGGSSAPHEAAPVPTAPVKGSLPAPAPSKAEIKSADPKGGTKNASTPTTQPIESNGTVAWTGELDSGQEIDLGAPAKGSVAGAFPGVPVTVAVSPSAVRIVTPLGAQNGWRHLVVHNDGKKQILILAKWSVINK
jgi:hypothetical protein